MEVDITALMILFMGQQSCMDVSGVDVRNVKDGKLNIEPGE